MNTQQMNLLLVDCLNDWDPFHVGTGNYDTEIADILQMVQTVDDTDELARYIQATYEFSFDEVIPLDQCKKYANKLLVIKSNSSCEIE
ncbi:MULTISPECIES: DUF1871 family protein [Cytobacillus]|uniref:DUF1871 family protein n=1 Tax=Cytobacillus stercorigallinarum TaxID=2762240 RepID=A0ABR8QUK1_9BACI|nr:DUF1871 family protein [Cytobacillus stercorigallinarum]MBD7939119.1 DUF1871 family protein [Cytobacillus stercorigallinarum]